MPFSDLVSIRLHTTHADSGPPLGICQLRFRHGGVLNVYGGTAYGGADEAQAARFRVFVHDLHRRLSPVDKERIVFHAGLSATRHAIVTAAMVAGALLFVLLPLILLIMAPSWHVLGLVAICVSLAYGGWRTWDRNRPGHYSPDQLPDDLLP